MPQTSGCAVAGTGGNVSVYLRSALPACRVVSLINRLALPGLQHLFSHLKEDDQRDGKCYCQNHQQLPGEVKSLLSHDACPLWPVSGSAQHSDNKDEGMFEGIPWVEIRT